MAGDWIKWTKGLTRKPEVLRMSAAMGITARETAAVLMEVWEWSDSNTQDGQIPGVTPDTVDNLIGVPGLGKAMIDTGWLLADDAGLIFPNFDRHNGSTAKKRLIEAEKKRRQRDK